MPDTFAQEFQSLREKYVASLNSRARQIHELWSMLRYLKWSDHGVKALQQLAHQLAGSGETFGFPAISQHAKNLELFLLEHQKPEQTIGGEERHIIDRHIEALTQALDGAMLPRPDAADDYSTTKKPAHSGHNKRVYIVDDDIALSALLAVYLRSAGFIAETFETPAACLRQLQQQTPDIILMDLGFPARGHVIGNTLGISATLEIHEQTGNQLPIILISSRSDISARLQALRAGCAGYLTKPLDFPALLKTLLSTLEQHEQAKRVMIVDDDESQANLHASILRSEGMEVLCVNQPMQSFQRAVQFKPDLVLLDMHMPDINGIELATLLRQEKQFTLLPMVFLTADQTQQVHQAIRALGVNALLTKPAPKEDLLAACKSALRDAQLLKSRIERVTRKTDNYQSTRYYLYAAIDNEIQRPKNPELPSAVYYIGVDHLAALSNQYGYAGIAQLHDAFCQKLSGIIGSKEQWSAVSNLTACVLVSPRSAEHHEARAMHIIRDLTQTPVTVAGEQQALDISAGVVYLTDAANGVNDVLLNAENAYEAAHNAGGNCARVYQASSPLRPSSNQNVSQSAPQAAIAEAFPTDTLPTANLALSYQPVIDIETKDVNHYDVLVRWRREDGELISAAKFMYQIKDPQMLVDLDRWILQTAVNAIASDSRTRESATLFLHLSAQTLQQKLFFSFAANLMRNARLRGNRRIVFILEEAWVLAEPTQAEILIKALRNAQCGVCLSRAGESNGMLSLLTEFEFDYVRLSPAMTEQIDERPGQQERIADLVEIARQTGSQVIATQVEDENHLALMWQLGVNLFQGFFIQPPGSAFQHKEDIALTRAPQKISL